MAQESFSFVLKRVCAGLHRILRLLNKKWSQDCNNIYFLGGRALLWIDKSETFSYSEVSIIPACTACL